MAKRAMQSLSLFWKARDYLKSWHIKFHPTLQQRAPYVASVAVVFAQTGCAKMISIQLRREHKPF
ncbi:hypothetical protein PHLH6_28260 [Pseudomonas sp. Seg1]|nr:hypothetical protein PHLH6_28260 [Pseudomonas sp. Seg1]